MDKKLKKLRKEIDKIDNKIVKLIGKRMPILKEIAQIKKKNNMKILDKERQNNLLKEKKELAKKLDISQKLVGKIFEEILKESIKIQGKIKK